MIRTELVAARAELPMTLSTETRPPAVPPGPGGFACGRRAGPAAGVRGHRGAGAFVPGRGVRARLPAGAAAAREAPGARVGRTPLTRTTIQGGTTCTPQSKHQAAPSRARTVC